MLEGHPQWVQQLARKYFSQTASQFILHGNIHDYVPVKENGSYRYYRLRTYLEKVLFKRRDCIIYYDRATGIQFPSVAMKEDFLQVLQAYDTLKGTQFASALPKDPTRALAIIENYLRIRLKEGKRVAVLLDYADTLIPEKGLGYTTAEERATLIFLLRWANDIEFLNSDLTTILIAENLSLLNQQFIRNPYTHPIDIPYPDETTRLHFINYLLEKHPHLKERMEMSAEVLAQQSGGLTLTVLRSLLMEVAQAQEPFGFDDLIQKKKELIEIEAGGLLSFVETPYNLDHVAGHKAAKKHLRQTAKAIKEGHLDVVPMGYLICGPVGTGKTFLVRCFAQEIGMPMVELKNFRSKWVGVTEANLERIFKILEAMAPVAVMIDEADAYLGDREQEGDSGLSSRVFSMIASFMSKSEHRGRILWFLLTARPDLMPVDLKRQGRAEEHIALFYPETVEEKRELFEVMLRKTKITSLSQEDFDDAFFESLPILSGAEMEALLTRSKFIAITKGLSQPDVACVKEAIEDFLPPTYPEEIEYMNYVAVLECTSRSLLPKRFIDLSREEVLERVRMLKARLGL